MIDQPLAAILILSFIGSIAGLVGGVLFLLKESWAKVLCRYAIPLASGVLLSVSIIQLLPEAVREIGDSAYVIVLISLLASFFFEEFFAHLHHHEGKRHTKSRASVPLVLLGDTIHNFIDGVAIASAFLVDPYFGIVVALATFFHETPHEIADFGILLSAGWSKKRALLANFLSATATFPGALWVYFSLQKGTINLGFLLAVAAGIFLYLGASDFLPEVGEEERGVAAWKKFSFLIFGVAVMYFLTYLAPEP